MILIYCAVLVFDLYSHKQFLLQIISYLIIKFIVHYYSKFRWSEYVVDIYYLTEYNEVYVTVFEEYSQLFVSNGKIFGRFC